MTNINEKQHRMQNNTTQKQRKKKIVVILSKLNRNELICYFHFLFVRSVHEQDQKPFNAKKNKIEQNNNAKKFQILCRAAILHFFSLSHSAAQKLKL